MVKKYMCKSRETIPLKRVSFWSLLIVDKSKMPPPGIHISTLYNTLPQQANGTLVSSRAEGVGVASLLTRRKEGAEGGVACGQMNPEGGVACGQMNPERGVASGQMNPEGGVVCELCGRSLPSAAWLPIHLRLIHSGQLACVGTGTDDLGRLGNFCTSSFPAFRSCIGFYLIPAHCSAYTLQFLSIYVPVIKKNR
jgi:hypothetical protein